MYEMRAIMTSKTVRGMRASAKAGNIVSPRKSEASRLVFKVMGESLQ